MVRIITVDGKDFEINTEDNLGRIISEVSTEKDTYRIYHGSSYNGVERDTGVRIPYVKDKGICIGVFMSDESYIRAILSYEEDGMVFTRNYDGSYRKIPAAGGEIHEQI